MTTNQITAAPETDYAIRKVTELRGIASGMFDLPATQETLKEAREIYLAESIALNQAPLIEAEAQKQRQISHQ